jgi:hypothetical protein
MLLFYWHLTKHGWQATPTQLSKTWRFWQTHAVPYTILRTVKKGWGGACGRRKKCCKKKLNYNGIQKYHVWKFQIHFSKISISIPITASCFMQYPFFLFQFGTDFKIINPIDIGRDLCARTGPIAKPAARRNGTKHMHLRAIYQCL